MFRRVGDDGGGYEVAFGGRAALHRRAFSAEDDFLALGGDFVEEAVDTSVLDVVLERADPAVRGGAGADL